MRRTLLIAACLVLAACSSNPRQLYQEQVTNSNTPLANTPAEAIRLASANALPIDPSWPLPQWEITAMEPRLKIGNTISNYRLFSVELKKDTPTRINVNSWCVNACLGFSKYALTPHLILVDEQGQVLANGFGKITGSVGSINQTLTGEVHSNGTYYLIVAADNRTPGDTVVIDNIMMIGAPKGSITPMRIGMGSYPFGTIAPYLSTSEE